LDQFSPHCVFCSIILRRSPATILYEDDAVIVFRNVLRWVPVMLLAVPKRHISQVDLWSEPEAVAPIAYEMGRLHAPDGFQLLSNFGGDAMQSQPHAHIHVIGGSPIFRGPCQFCGELKESVPSRDGVLLEAVRPCREWSFVPLALRARLDGVSDHPKFWESVRPAAEALLAEGIEKSSWGFRLITHISDAGDGPPESREPHLHLLGGTFLGEYA
jgi:histidine triad (HIT) family protein